MVFTATKHGEYFAFDIFALVLRSFFYRQVLSRCEKTLWVRCHLTLRFTVQYIISRALAAIRGAISRLRSKHIQPRSGEALHDSVSDSQGSPARFPDPHAPSGC